jgi:hypothetical protein
MMELSTIETVNSIQTLIENLMMKMLMKKKQKLMDLETRIPFIVILPLVSHSTPQKNLELSRTKKN